MKKMNFKMISRGNLLAILSATLVVSLSVEAASKKADEEAEYYPITTFELPEESYLEAGAIQLMPDGKIAVSTRFGDIYMVSDPYAKEPKASQFKLYAHGLHEVLGLTIHDGWLYATQRGEITRMKDTKNDGRADVFETVSDQWGINGDYHEYAFGSKVDEDNNIWVVLCLTGSFTSENPYRGWCLRVNADTGETIPTTSGIRSPGGIGTNHVGEVFYTDNQGTMERHVWIEAFGARFVPRQPTGEQMVFIDRRAR